jgi:putative ABC transport system substrate-binding protein
VDVIAVYGTPPARAAKQATTTIPIVMIGIGDPVGAGLVRPLVPRFKFRSISLLAHEDVGILTVCQGSIGVCSQKIERL